MQLYDITIPANTTRQLDAPGSYFYYYAGSAGGADPTITLRGVSSGLRLILKPGQAFRLPEGNTETAWVMTNYGNAATIIGSVLVGDGDITDNRVTGSVEVIDGGKNLSKGGTAYISTSYATAIAGQVMAVALWNKSTDTNLIMKQLRYDVSGAGFSIVHRRITATFGVKDQDSAKKLINGGISTKAETYQLTGGVSSPASSTSLGVDITLARQVITFNEPIIIPPLTGYMLQNNVGTTAPTNALTAVFEHIEEPA